VGAVDTPTVEIQPVIGDRILETENSRLTFENAMLRQRCHEATAAVHQASAAAATMASMAQVATVPLTMPGGCYSVQVPVLTPNYTNVTPMALDEFALALPRFGLYPPVYVAHPGLQATMPTPVLAAAAYGQDWRAVEQPINDADAANSMAPRRSSQEPTTLMLRNLPNDYTRAMCLKLFDDAGFTGQYDFFYLPIDFKSNCGGVCFCEFDRFTDSWTFLEDLRGIQRLATPKPEGAVCSLEQSFARFRGPCGAIPKQPRHACRGS
jgi:hypothetical protein